MGEGERIVVSKRPRTLLDRILFRSVESSGVHPSRALTVMIMTSAPKATASDLSTPVQNIRSNSTFIDNGSYLLLLYLFPRNPPSMLSRLKFNTTIFEKKLQVIHPK